MTTPTTEEAIAEVWQLFKETDARIRALEGLFTNQWGRMMEALVHPGVLRLFQERGHKVERLHRRSTVTVNGETKEIDLILENTTEVVVVEVKSTLGVEDINEFLVDLAEFTDYFPVYRNFQIFGAVAGLDVPVEVARYAYRRGLFVLNIVGDGVVQIQNDSKFRPRDFHPEA